MIHTFIHLLDFDVEAFKKDNAALIPEEPSPLQSQLISFSKYYPPKDKANILLVWFVKPINMLLHQFIFEVI